MAAGVPAGGRVGGGGTSGARSASTSRAASLGSAGVPGWHFLCVLALFLPFFLPWLKPLGALPMVDAWGSPLCLQNAAATAGYWRVV